MDPNAIDTYREKIASLAQPATADDWKAFNQLQPLATLIADLDSLESKTQQAREMITSESDKELIDLAQTEIQAAHTKKQTLLDNISEEIKSLESSQQSDTQEDRNAIIEIRAGAGGEEAALFAADLFRMYSMYAQKKGFQIEIFSQHLSTSGGFKEIITRLSGENVFGTMRYESGVHRVQRVPSTEASGRIHTSTASVAVMPEAAAIDVVINPGDLQIDTYHSAGAGGQHVNKTDSAVRITHLPTGTIATCQESRSQLKNREIAMNLLRSRLYEQKLEEQQSKDSSMRKQQIGSAMRAEKIRTYNFPQNRVTDHRLKQSWHNISAILNGELDDIISALHAKKDTPEN